MIKRRRILAISPFIQWPLVNGTVVRTWHFVNYLSRQNEVWFASREGERPGPKTPMRSLYNVSGRFSQLLQLGFLNRLRRLILKEEIDLIIVIHLWSILHGLLLKWLTGRRLLFDNHNVEYLRWRRMGSFFWPFVGILEFVACHSADQVICVSEGDRRLLEEKLRVPTRKLQVISNGVDVERFQQAMVDVDKVRKNLGVEKHEQEILFFGPLSHRANAQAADIILDELAPRLQKVEYPWKLIIAGADADNYLKKRGAPLPADVVFTGFVDDIVALIKSADIVIVPLTAGSGTRYKILESVAAGRPVVSTSIGAEGLDMSVFGDSLVIRDEWDAFVGEIVKQRHHPPQSTLSPAFVAAYDWDQIFARADLHI